MTQPSFWHIFGTAALVVWGGTAAQAQTVYRIVGADGKVTFSDKRPASKEQGKVVGTGVGASGAASSTGLPFELRQIANKYPVTLYTANKCGPCDSARALLSSRGIPFTERSVNTAEDGESLQRISGDTSLPFVTIGGQRLKGFTDSEWSQYLDAAGYPKTSVLAAGYKNPAPTPLVAILKPIAPTPKVEEKPAPPPAPAKTADNPTGIIF